MGAKSIVKPAVMLAILPFCKVAIADWHTQEALRHASQAADSAGDAKTLGGHAAEALKHIEAAKATYASHAGIIKQLDKGEADLKSAVRNASRFNTDTAARDALDAEIYLKAADTAARRLESVRMQAEPANKK